MGTVFMIRVIRAGAQEIVGRCTDDGQLVRLLYGTENGDLVTPQSGVVVPILSGGRVLGVLSAQSYRSEAYEDADLFSLSAIAVQAGITVKRLHATEQMALEHEPHPLELEAGLRSITHPP